VVKFLFRRKILFRTPENHEESGVGAGVANFILTHKVNSLYTPKYTRNSYHSYHFILDLRQKGLFDPRPQTSFHGFHKGPKVKD
jgi:hypothetical protein